MEHHGPLGTSRIEYADLRDVGAHGPIWSMERAAAGFWDSVNRSCTGSDGEGYLLALDAKGEDRGVVTQPTDVVGPEHGNTVTQAGSGDQFRYNSAGAGAWILWNGTDPIAPNPELDPINGVSSWSALNAVDPESMTFTV